MRNSVSVKVKQGPLLQELSGFLIFMNTEISGRTHGVSVTGDDETVNLTARNQ